MKKRTLEECRSKNAHFPCDDGEEASFLRLPAIRERIHIYIYTRLCSNSRQHFPGWFDNVNTCTRNFRLRGTPTRASSLSREKRLRKKLIVQLALERRESSATRVRGDWFNCARAEYQREAGSQVS